MVSNRKARLLLRVPSWGGVRVEEYRISNHKSAVIFDGRFNRHRVYKWRAAQARAFKRFTATMRRRTEEVVYDSLLPLVGKPIPALADMDLSQLEDKVMAAYGSVDAYASFDRDIAVVGTLKVKP